MQAITVDEVGKMDKEKLEVLVKTVLRYMVLWDFQRKQVLESDVEFVQQHQFKTKLMKNVVELFPITQNNDLSGLKMVYGGSGGQENDGQGQADGSTKQEDADDGDLQTTVPPPRLRDLKMRADDIKAPIEILLFLYFQHIDEQSNQ